MQQRVEEKSQKNASSAEPLFIMSAPKVHVEYKNSPEKINDIKIIKSTHYHFSFIAATIEAIQGKVLDMASYREVNDDLENLQSSFSRDFAITLEDKRVILIPSDYLDFNDTAGMLWEISKRYHLQLVNVPGSYFEGGNALYAAKEKVLLHGRHPAGGYRMSYRGFYFVPIIETEERLTNALKSFDIKLVSVHLSAEILSRESLYCFYFYHLDVFMSYIDGRLFILNKKILAPTSCKELENIFGERFIDLQYEKYLSEPCFINILAVSNASGTKYLCTNIPAEVAAAFKKYGLEIITADMLDSESANFNFELACKVAAKLSEKGYKNVNRLKLTTEVPEYGNQFFFENGEPFLDSTENIHAIPAEKFTFNYCGGGPRCLTMSINIDKQPRLFRRRSFIEGLSKIQVSHEAETSEEKKDFKKNVRRNSF